MNKRIPARTLALALAMAICGTTQAADLQLQNGDAPGVGLNETTPAAPVGGNPGTTLGEQRLKVYQYAMALWGKVLGGYAPVLINASFPALTCTASSAVLGSAGAYWSASDAARRYHGALANARNKTDLAPAWPEIIAQFNPNLGQPACLAGSGWYYGLDGNTPAGKINFLNVVMHEIGHGLGVSGYINKTSGAWSGMPDVYTARAYDNLSGKSFIDPGMTSAQRAIAMRTVGATTWTGANVNQQAALTLDAGYQDPPYLQVTAPASLARPYGFQRAAFGAVATPANFSGSNWVLAVDPSDAAGPSVNDGCSPLTNGAAISGNIAMIDRGSCGFAVKVKNAQNAGATAVVVLNSNVTPPAAADSNWGSMGGVDATITIPAILVRYADGLTFRSAAPSGGIALGPVTLAGMDTNGRTRLYSPWVVASGSTFSHFDTALSPNVLMEPFDTPEIQAQLSLDLTPALLRDIGWPMREGNAKLMKGYCDTGIPVAAEGGFVTGANVEIKNESCRTGATRMGYFYCMRDYADSLYASNQITSSQRTKLTTCARREADTWR